MWTTDGRTPDHEYPISSPIAKNHLKMNIFTAVKYCYILHGRVCVMNVCQISKGSLEYRGFVKMSHCILTLMWDHYIYKISRILTQKTFKSIINAWDSLIEQKEKVICHIIRRKQTHSDTKPMCSF